MTELIELPASRARRRRRRWLPRFGLRSLFVVAVIFCLLCGWVGRNLYRMRQQEAAIERLKSARATLSERDGEGRWHAHPETPWPFDYPEPPPVVTFWQRAAMAVGLAEPFRVTDANFYFAQAGDDALDALVVFPDLRALVLRGDGFTNASIDKLSRLPALEELTLGSTRISGAGLARLRSLPRLRLLQLEAPADGDSLLQSVIDMQELRSLSVSGTSLSSKRIDQIAALPNLEEVELGGVTLPPGAIETLAASPRLKSLVLDAPLSSEAVAALVKTNGLRRLHIHGDIDDQRLMKLSELNSLREFYVAYFHVSESAVQEFSRRLPGCRVQFLNSNHVGVEYHAGELVMP